VVSIPDAAADGPRWPVTAPVALVTLLVGLGAGRACSTKLFPPVDAVGAANGGPEGAGSAAAASSVGEASSATANVGASASASAAATSTAPELPTYAIVTVGRSQLMHCQDPPAGELSPSRCGDPGLDAAVVPALEQLSSCLATASISGRLSLTIDIDQKKDVRKVVAGRGSSLTRGTRRDDRAIAPIVDCARKNLAAVTIPESAKSHTRWVLAFPVTLAAPPSAAGSSAPSASAPAERAVSGSSVVQVDTAIVRDGPSTSGAPIGRLSRGTRVTTVGTSGHWYHIKYGENDASEGWIFRTNIGR
jgi:uncharacterized protein YgiM (DUF1202 family)